MNTRLFWDNRFITYLVLTVVFGTLYALNHVLTAPLLLAPGAHLVHLPSGFKLLLVLVFGLVGAFSVFTVSLLAGSLLMFIGELTLTVELAAVNALAPWLTVKFFVDQEWVRPDLNNLQLKALAGMGLVFATLNSAMNQMVLYWNQVIHNLIDGLRIMFTGDVTGVVLVLLLMRTVVWWHKRRQPATDQATEWPPEP